MSDQKSATPDIDTQIESLLNEALIVWKQDYPKFDRDGMGSNDTRMAEYFERLEKAKTKAHKAIKTLLIQQIDDALARQATPTALSKQADNPSEMAYLIRQSNLIEGIDNRKEDKYSLECWNWLSKVRKMNEQVLLRIHKDITRRQLDGREAGHYRKVDVWVGEHQGVKPELIQLHMDDWLATFMELDPKQAHITFEKIHPFVDGNGRTGRMLMWWQELKQGLPITPILNSNKQHYYRWFTEGNDLVASGLEGTLYIANPPSKASLKRELNNADTK